MKNSKLLEVPQITEKGSIEVIIMSGRFAAYAKLFLGKPGKGLPTFSEYLKKTATFQHFNKGDGEHYRLFL